MIITVEDIKGFAGGIQPDDNSVDDTITTLISQKQKRIETFIGSALELQEYTEVVSGDNSNIVRLRNLPVVEITEVTNSEGADAGISFDGLNDSRAYSSGCLIANQTIRGRITIKYNAGYKVDEKNKINEVPEDIKNACIKLVVADLMQGKVINIISDNDESAYTPASLRKSAYSELELYRQMRIA